jgi:hypothetical protein
VGQQVPSRPTWLQELHAPWQATLQQTPSAQKPDAHSLFFEQTAVRGFGPQLPFTHLTPLTQSPSVLQEEKHVFDEGSQSKGAQTVAGPGLQRPPESQTYTPEMDAPSHAPALHTDPVAYLRQAPAPLHVPSSPHVETSALGHTVADRGGAPFGTNEQVPGAAAVLHALQVSAQAVLQQRPSTQNPLVQSPPQPQACPFAFFIPPVPLQATSACASTPPSGGTDFLPLQFASATSATTLINAFARCPISVIVLPS